MQACVEMEEGLQELDVTGDARGNGNNIMVSRTDGPVVKAC